MERIGCRGRGRKKRRSKESDIGDDGGHLDIFQRKS